MGNFFREGAYNKTQSRCIIIFFPGFVLGGGEWNKTAELRKEVTRGGQGRRGVRAEGWRDGASSPRVASTEFPEVPQIL